MPYKDKKMQRLFNKHRVTIRLDNEIKTEILKHTNNVSKFAREAIESRLATYSVDKDT